MSDGSLYEQPPAEAPTMETSTFYHVMEIPGHGVTEGKWDLREGVDDYLGHVPLAGRRVLEIGPASGFLTVEMEKRGADVVAVELPDDPGWNFVPYPAAVMEPVYETRRAGMRRVKNSWWFIHAAHRSKAKVVYGNVYDLPEALGSFDVAVMAAVLLHTHSPLQIVEQCAMRADTLVITDLFYPDLKGPICRLSPTRENHRWDTWWDFSPEFFVRFLEVMGFEKTVVTTHVQHHRARPRTLFTVVASERDVP